MLIKCYETLRCILMKNFTEMYPWCFKWQQTNFDSGTKSLSVTNADQVLWRHELEPILAKFYDAIWRTSPGYNKFKFECLFFEPTPTWDTIMQRHATVQIGVKSKMVRVELWHLCQDIFLQSNQWAEWETNEVTRSGGINSSPPSASYVHKWIGSALVQIMACHQFSAMPLSKPMLGYCQLNL